MTPPLFLRDDLGTPAVGEGVILDGPEGRHAAVVRRIEVGETIMIGDGRGFGVRGPVTAVTKTGLAMEVDEQLRAPRGSQQFIVCQALAKGDRAELAIEMLTELGVDEIYPWSARNCVVRWTPDRREKAHARWVATVREAAKQSRRLTVPVVHPLASTIGVAHRMMDADLNLVLHEGATTSLADVKLPNYRGHVVIVVGPEGGITEDELAIFTATRGRAVSVSDGILRTSTAGVVALAALKLR